MSLDYWRGSLLSSDKSYTTLLYLRVDLIILSYLVDFSLCVPVLFLVFLQDVINEIYLTFIDPNKCSTFNKYSFLINFKILEFRLNFLKLQEGFGIKSMALKVL